MKPRNWSASSIQKARDENVDYYVGKLSELTKKFAGFSAPSGQKKEPAQTDLGF